uniref:acetyl-CoA C-acetyltransferase n=1 Tax=Marmota marmota marmota TaxID=9994 RepID=A0A8C5ZAX2_MARMA
MLKLQVLRGHLTSLPESGPVLQTVPCFGSFLQASAADVVLLRGGCTPSSPQVQVPLQDTTPDELLSAVLTQLGDISEGNVLHPGGGAIMARIAQPLTFCFTGIPDTVPMSIVNGQCSSGLQAVANIVGGIGNGSYDIGMACGITSENVVRRFGVSREKQDSFALASQAARAQSKGCFRAEIVPVTTTIHDDKGTKRSITVSQDEGIRPNTTMEGLAKLKPAFKDGGSPTAGLTVNDVDIFEINEAIVSQAVYLVALGHPLGCTGARQVITLLNELKRRGKRAYGVVSMCIGTGMGATAVFEYPGN